jgi:hypothetical protein
LAIIAQAIRDPDRVFLQERRCTITIRQRGLDYPDALDLILPKVSSEEVEAARRWLNCHDLGVRSQPPEEQCSHTDVRATVHDEGLLRQILEVVVLSDEDLFERRVYAPRVAI